MSDMDRRGRLDLLVKDVLGRFAERFGIRNHVQPVIDRFVDEQVDSHKVPVSPVQIAEHMGILKRSRNK